MPKEAASQQNHTLLIQLADNLAAIGKQLGAHITEQQQENIRLHSRIDETQTQARTGVMEIKDSLASRGRISSGQVFSFVAVLVSLMTMAGGLSQAYISVRLGNITPLIDANTAATAAVNAEQQRQREELTRSRVDNARSEGRMTEAIRWLESRQAVDRTH